MNAVKKNAPLEGRIALVTGGAKKVGAAVARALAAAGADVAVNYLSSRKETEKTVAAVRAAGRRALAVRADVTRPSQAARLFRTVEKRLGPVAILVNNVGSFLLKPLVEVTFEEWNRILASNLHSAFLCSREALPGMRKQGFGRIVNLGYGPCGRTEAVPRTVPYHTAKTALLVYTKGLAREVASWGITVNMVSPGTIFTSVHRPPAKTIPAGRYGRYDDVAEAVLFLCGKEAEYITGNNLLVTGGKYVGL